MPTKIPEARKISQEEVEHLTGYNFFSSFNHNEISLLLLCAEQVSYEKDEVILREGDTGLHFYAVLSGEIVISREKSGRELGRLKQGRVFGEMAVLDGHPRSATAIAASRSELLVFDGNRLLGNFPHLSVKLLRFMAHELSMRVRKADDLIDLFH